MKKKKNLIGSDTYTPTYKLEKTNYQRFVDENGFDIEIIGYYKADEHMMANPPSYEKELNVIKKTLLKTGISKITIIFLNKNL